MPLSKRIPRAKRKRSLQAVVKGGSACGFQVADFRFDSTVHKRCLTNLAVHPRMKAVTLEKFYGEDA
jgi:hypothetical protein